MAEAAAVNSPGVSSWVGEALDGAGSWAVRSKAPWLFGLLMLFDSWDSIVIAFTLPVLITQWDLSTVQSGTLISAGYGGQFIGALVFGTVAERFGRLPVLRLLVLMMSLLALACAFAQSYEQMLTFRAIQGLAIGGALPVVICYINEIAPTETRGRFFGTFQFLMVSGFGLASLVSAILVPRMGWEIMYGLGAIPLLLLPLTYAFPESPRWLASHGRPSDSTASLKRLGAGVIPPENERNDDESSVKVPFALLFEPAIRKTSFITALLWFLTSFVSFGLVTWIPSIYVSMFNISVENSLKYSAITTIAVFILPIILRQTLDTLGRRPLPIIGTGIGGIALFAIIFINVDATLVVVTLAIIGQIGISISSMVLWPYTAETFSTRIRALALGTSSSIARGASMLTPLLVGVVLSTSGSVTLVFMTFGLAAFAVALLWLFGTKETAGQKMPD